MGDQLAVEHLHVLKVRRWYCPMIDTRENS